MKLLTYSLLFALIFIYTSNILQAQPVNVNDSLAVVEIRDNLGNNPDFNYVYGSTWQGSIRNWSGITITGNRVTGLSLAGYSDIIFVDGDETFVDYFPLRGNIPQHLFDNLTALTTLNFHFNELRGNVPASLSNLASLTNIDLSYNQLKGFDAASIKNLPAITNINLTHDSLIGSIPVALSNLSSLTSINLANNYFSDNIPSLLGSITNLVTLDLSNNQLTGSIPPSLGNFSHPVFISLVNNNLSGEVPLSLSNLKPIFNPQLTTYAISVYGNYFSFSDLLPLLQQYPATSITYGGQKTKLLLYKTGNIFSVAAYDTLKTNTYAWKSNGTNPATITGDSTYTPTLAGYLYADVTNKFVPGLTLYTDSVMLEPSVQVSLTDTKALSDLYDSCGGAYTNQDDAGWRSTNWGNGYLYEWPGVGVSLNTGRVISLNLEEAYEEQIELPDDDPDDPYIFFKGIQGRIPASFGNLTELQHIDFSNNSITILPTSFSNLTKLTYLNLSYNNFTHDIPSVLQTLTQLTSLRLSNNKFTGSVPTWLGNLTKLTVLNLATNRLAGIVPSSLENLHQLQRLNLRNNKLNAFPAAIANNTTLSYLDLTNNKFTFNALQPLATALNFNKFIIQYQDTILPIHASGKIVSVSAGGTLSKNSYQWYSTVGTSITTINKTGDSTLTLTQPGYHLLQVSVYNSALHFYLGSNTFGYTPPTNNIKQDADDDVVTSALNANISIYPNPVRNEINVSTGYLQSPVTTIQIIAVNGQLLAEKQVTTSNKLSVIKMNVQQLSAGSYYVLLKTKNKTFTKKLLSSNIKNLNRR